MTKNEDIAQWFNTFFCYLFINTFVHFLVYGFQSKALLAVVGSQTATSGSLLLSTYVFSLSLSLHTTLFLFCGLIYLLFRSPRVSKSLLYVVMVVEIILLAVLSMNSLVFRFLGIHLDDPMISDTLRDNGLAHESQLGWRVWLTLLAAFVGICLLEWLLMKLSQRLGTQSRYQHKRLSRIFVVVGAGALVFTSTYSVWGLKQAEEHNNKVLEVLPFYASLTTPKLSQAQWKVNYPTKHKAYRYPTVQKRPNILFILVEALRSDVFHSTLMPHLHRFAKQHQCVPSKRHYAGGQESIWGTFSALYGVSSSYLSFFAHEDVPSYAFQLLKQNGYYRAGISASRLLGWSHGMMFAKQFDHYQEHLDKKGHENDARVLKEMQKFMSEYQRQQPLFMFTYLFSPHYNHYYPKEFERFKPVLPEKFGIPSSKLRLFKEKIFNRYKNSVLYTDHLFHQLTKIFKKQIEEKNLIIVLTGDHGEEFWENGVYGHSANRFFNPQIQVPLLLCLPNHRFQKKVALSGHTDIWPTIIDYMRPKPDKKWTRYFTGSSILRPRSKDYFTTVGSYGFPNRRSTVGMLTPKYKYWFKRRSGMTDFRLTRLITLDDKAPLVSPLGKHRSHRTQQLQARITKYLAPRKLALQKEPSVPHRVDARFGSLIRVVGYDSYGVTKVTRGLSIRLTYTFEILKKIPKAWRFFFHLTLEEPYKHINLVRTIPRSSRDLSSFKAGDFIQISHWVQIPLKFPDTGKIFISMGMWAPKKGRQPIHLGRKSFSTKNKRLRIITLSLISRAEFGKAPLQPQKQIAPKQKAQRKLK